MNGTIIDIVTFIGGGSIVAAILVAWLKKYIKEKIEPRFGDLGIMILLGIISLVMALGYYGWQFIPKEVLTTMTMIMGWAVLIYQALWKAVVQKAIRNKLDTDETK